MIKAAKDAGQDDVVGPATEARVQRIKNTPCPRCGTSLSPVLAPTSMLFSENDPLPKTLGECKTCGFTASDESHVVYHTGDPRRVDDPLPIIRPKD
jgi:hypothetical protein